MKIKNWIEFLSKFPEDLDVEFLCPDGFDETFDIRYEVNEKTLELLPYNVTRGKKVNDEIIFE